MPRPEATTLPIHAALGVSTAELDDALVWARGRTAELLASLDDAELRALLDREPAASPPRSRTPTPAPRPPEPVAPALAVAPWGLPPVPRIPSRFVETIASKSASPAEPRAAMQGSESTPASASRSPPPKPPPAPASASRPPPPKPPPPPPSAPPRVAPATASLPPRAPAKRAVPQREDDAPAARTDHSRRSAQRHALSTSVVVRIESLPGFLELNTRDISRHGIFIESNAPPECHARIAVQLPFPDGSAVVHLVGEVVRVVTMREAAASGRAPGFGVTFSPVSDESRRDLERLLEHVQSGAAADVPRPRGSAATQAQTIQRARSPSAKVSKG